MRRACYNCSSCSNFRVARLGPTVGAFADPRSKAMLMTADSLLDRAAELKRQLVEYSQSGRYSRAFRQMLAEHGEDAELWDEERAILLWDSFLLEHRLRDGRTVVEQFVDARSDLSLEDRELL